MTRHTLPILLILLLLTLNAPAAAQAQQPSPPEKTRVLVALQPGASAQRLTADEAAMATDGVEVLHQFSALPGLTAAVTPAGLTALQQRPDVAAITPDLPVHAALTQSKSFINVDVVQQTFGLTGQGVTIALLDTGVDLEHPDLAGRVIAQHCFNRGESCPPDDGEQLEKPEQSANAQDENGHGTHVAGILVGEGMVGPMGIAPAAELVAVRVLDGNGLGYTSDVLAGLDWVLANQAELQVEVINLSLGGGSYSDICDESDANTLLYAQAIEQARQADIAVFAAAGNAANAEGLLAPACVDGAVAVGNVYDADLGTLSWPTCRDSEIVAGQVACASNSSPALDLLAPGVLIESAGLGGGTSIQSGTSMSTPHAAAVAALLRQAQPTLSVAELEAALFKSGVPVTDPRNQRVTPRLDALAALEAVLPQQTKTISGQVQLQGRTTHSGITLYLSTEACAEEADVTVPTAIVEAADGRFALALPSTRPAGCLYAQQPGYLSAQFDGPVAEVGLVTLPAGDINGDAAIDILDLAAIAQQFQGNDPQADVNASGLVDLFDLVLAAQNFGQRGPIEWPAGP